MKYLKYLLLILLITLFSIQKSQAERKKKILVLHSYHQGLEWTDNVSRGIEDIFSPLRSQYEVYYEYLDSKRNAGNAYLQQSASFISTKNSQEKYEIVIAVDNNALKLLNSRQITFLGSPPIIFCGINNYDDSLISELDQVTGIVETTDHFSTLDIMHKLHPNKKNITVILDKTPTGRIIREEFDAVIKHYQNIFQFNFMSDFLLKDIPKLVNELSENDLIYILTFNRDSDNNFISYTEGIEMIVKYTNVPIYGSWDFYLNKGIVGGKITAGFLQGETAAKQALQALKGEPIDSIDIILDGASEYMFDYHFLTKNNVNINELPKDSIIINRPEKFLEKYQSVLLNIFVSLFILVLAILYKAKQKESSMRANYTQRLESKVKERTIKLKEVNQKLEWLSNIDGLTQIFNRRYFDTVLSQELLNHQKSKETLVLMICDIDYFKRYNDTYGHLAGDDCIKMVASILKAHCKKSTEIVARYGGEEFALIMPRTSQNEAKKRAEAIRLSIVEKALPHQSSDLGDFVSISIGVAIMNATKTTAIENIIGLADEALYESKNSGRNKTTVKSN